MTARQIDAEQKRLGILGDDELETIYGIPHFTYEDRCNYFFLSNPEKELLQVLRSVKSQAYFVLQLGYFKSKHRFFTFDLFEVVEDLQYVLKQYFAGSVITDLNSIKKLTKLKHQHLILELTNYLSFNEKERQQLKAKARNAATVCGKPIYIFREIIHYLSERRIVAPGYRFMRDIVGKAISYEQNRLITIIQKNLKESDIEALNQLLKDSSGLYEIAQIKHEPKDFSVGEIKREINRGKQIKNLYLLTQKLIPLLGISNESSKYYASLVDYYSVYKLKQLNEWIASVYLLCFVRHRYQRMHDNLINTLIYNVRRYTDESKFKAKEQVYESYTENGQNIKKAGQVLKIFTDDSIGIDTPFRDVQATAFAILERQKIIDIAEQISTNAKLDETAFQWEHIGELAHQFKRHLRPIFLMVDFVSPLTHDPLIEAINFMKVAFIKNKPLGQYLSEDFPNQFIPDSIKRYMFKQDTNGEKTLLVDNYEFLVYRLLRNGLESGDIFCSDSILFKSFEDDLIDDHQWQQKEKLITDASLTILMQPIHNHLIELEQRLETRIKEVNQRLHRERMSIFK